MPARARFPTLRVLSWGAVALAAIPGLYLVIRGAQVPEAAALAFRDPTTWTALARTAGLALGSGAVCVVIALPLAWWTHATDLPGRAFFRLALNLPFAVPSYVGGFVVLIAFGPRVYGGLGALLALLFSYPLVLLNLQAALARTDPRLWESARSLGATPWVAFWRVIFPAIRRSAAHGFLLVALYAVGDFGAVSLLRFRSLSYVIYLRYQSLFDRHEAVWLGLLLALVATLLVAVLVWVGGRSVRGLERGGAGARWPVIQLGAWRIPALLVCLGILALGVVAPVFLVAGWLVRGLSLGADIAFPVAETGRTIGVAAVAAVLVVALGVAPAILKRFSRTAAGGRWVINLGYALPGIVVALALVSFGVNVVPFMYQTLALLLIAYSVRFLPLALHTMDDAIGSSGERTFAAARSLGCTPAQAVMRVVLPGVRPALIAAALAVFIAVIKELPLTLLVSPIGFDTLATRIWGLTEDAYFAAAAPAVLLLIVVAGVGLVLNMRMVRGPA